MEDFKADISLKVWADMESNTGDMSGEFAGMPYICTETTHHVDKMVVDCEIDITPTGDDAKDAEKLRTFFNRMQSKVVDDYEEYIQ